MERENPDDREITVDEEQIDKLLDDKEPVDEKSKEEDSSTSDTKDID